jgi:cytochrome c peroxidase
MIKKTFVLALALAYGSAPLASDTPMQRPLSEADVNKAVAYMIDKNLTEKDMRVLSAQPLPDPLIEDDFRLIDEEKAALGHLLFFDKELSGNRNISCATCHHPFSGMADGLTLPVGEGGGGLSTGRNTGLDADSVHERVPRNAPATFGLGAHEHTVLFHDGRVMVDASQPSGFISPAGDDLPMGLDSVLAAQAMFPVQSGTEMAGQAGENSVGDAAAIGDLAGPNGVWAQLAGRIAAIDEYAEMFINTYDDVSQASDITYVHIANAIAAFEENQGRVGNSPFDQYLAGDTGAMSQHAIDGMELFYGDAGCASCHSGKFFTDNDFHAIGAPQIGPGKGNNLPGFSDGMDDFGRERETGNPADRFRFRTPPLRNIAITGPYMHSGAYNSLEAVIRHHMDAEAALENYDASQLLLPSRRDLNALDLAVMSDWYSRRAIAAEIEIPKVDLSDEQVARLVSFLHALSEPNAMDMRMDVPQRVPSGLPVFD